MSVYAEELRIAMRRWATGVTVVSVNYQGERHGMTVSSFTSISLNPSLILVSLEQGTKTHRLVEQAGYFGVTILADGQESISRRFAGVNSEGEDRFAGIDTFTLVSGAPLIQGGLSFLDCRVVSTLTAGTHTIFIGEVLVVQQGQVGQPLIYYQQGYHTLC
jgi:3-hydroxy-9,10-secoandrosta-1,3,5(10)-triene-9,17-dione monooxygenase reductase component